MAIGLRMGWIDDMHTPLGGAAGIERLCLDGRSRRHLLPDDVQLQPSYTPAMSTEPRSTAYLCHPQVFLEEW